MLGGFRAGNPRRSSVDSQPMPQILLDELENLGNKIKHHQENVNYLGTLVNQLGETSRVLQGSLPTINSEVTEDVKTEDETIKCILKHEKSAAAIICRLQRMSSSHSLVTDLVGIVATLGKVDDDNLSRLLSKYLGLEKMLAVVCKTYEGVKSLETYNMDGSIDKKVGIHDFAAKTGAPLSDRFLVICLEHIRPYPGQLIADDPQKRLDLVQPRLANGQTPPGFLGFAVNMINIDPNNLYCVSKNGHNLRQTLFYDLFSNVQVYRSRKDMLHAFSCIRTGAISLDGGIIKHPALFSLGDTQSDIDVKFPKDSEKLKLPHSYFDVQNKINETYWRKDCTSNDLQREQELLNKLKSSYEEKKKKYLDFIAGSAPQTPEFSLGNVWTQRR